MKKITLNNRGSILQIVLVLFLIVVSCLTLRNYTIHLELQTYQKVDRLMKQKNLEIMLCRYYLETLENDILFDEVYEYKGYMIQSEFDDMGSYMLVDTEVSFQEESYHFILKVSEDYQTVLDFYYEGANYIKFKCFL